MALTTSLPNCPHIALWNLRPAFPGRSLTPQPAEKQSNSVDKKDDQAGGRSRELGSSSNPATRQVTSLGLLSPPPNTSPHGAAGRDQLPRTLELRAKLIQPGISRTALKNSTPEMFLDEL